MFVVPPRSGRTAPISTPGDDVRAAAVLRVLVVDAHPVVREGLKRVFERTDGLLLVGEADTFDRALSFREAALDVVILEMGLPGVGVLEAIRQVRAFRAHPRVVVFSSCPERHCAARLVNGGAAAYVWKSRPVEELVRAVREVASGRLFVPSEAGLGRPLSPLGMAELHEDLSDREFHVLLEMGVGKSVNTIATEWRLSPKTVRTYRARLLKKLKLSSTAEMIHYVARTGLQPAHVEPVAWSTPSAADGGGPAVHELRAGAREPAPAGRDPVQVHRPGWLSSVPR